ncbi:MAG: alpha/beta fold hydrolase [Parvibaculaceae bacterium]
MSLDHYEARSLEIYRVPLLFVMPPTSKAYVFDLLPGQSFFEFLLEAGYDIYVMDWSNPGMHEKHLDLEHYVTKFIDRCASIVRERSGEKDISIAGYCMGGVLSVIYAALNPQAPIRNLICFTTPFDWSEWGLFNKLSDPAYFNVDQMVDVLGIIPADLISSSLEMLRPASKIATPIQVWDNMWNDEFVRSNRALERWAGDALSVPGEYFRDIIKELMFKNSLFTGSLVMGGRTVRVEEVRASFLHAVAKHDHIVPEAVSQELVKHIGSEDKQEIVVKGGHVSVVAGANAIQRLWPQIDQWLGERSV